MVMESEPRPTELPAAIRRNVVDFAAAVLAESSEDLIPLRLRHIKRFAPNRRATAGAVPILAVLEQDQGFRFQVARYVRVRFPELSQALDEQPPPPDPSAELMALAYLSQVPMWPQWLAQAQARTQAMREDQSQHEAERQAAALRAQLAEQQGQTEAELAQLRAAQLELTTELAAARKELRRHRADADRARAHARAAVAESVEIRAKLDRDAITIREQEARLRAELAQVKQDLQILRQSDRTSRAAVASRARLLLDTLLAAGAGLRDELGLAAVEVRPADLVGAAPIPPGVAQPLADRDPSRLNDLLTLPQAHLIIDGYNVTIGAYSELPLAQQRARLLSGLSAIFARTRAEITCCFDGAQLSGRIVPPATRGMRVRFSEPGSTADELIARLVRAEPVGRVVIVVSNDQEVAQASRRAHAFAVPSEALLALLEPGWRDR